MVMRTMFHHVSYMLLLLSLFLGLAKVIAQSIDTEIDIFLVNMTNMTNMTNYTDLCANFTMNDNQTDANMTMANFTTIDIDVALSRGSLDNTTNTTNGTADWDWDLYLLCLNVTISLNSTNSSSSRDVPTQPPVDAASGSLVFSLSSPPTMRPSTPVPTVKNAPTIKPTTVSPTKRPSFAPTKRPSNAPTKRPTNPPTRRPNIAPTVRPPIPTAPTERPNNTPSFRPPVSRPTFFPTVAPTIFVLPPTSSPTFVETTENPTEQPTTDEPTTFEPTTFEPTTEAPVEAFPPDTDVPLEQGDPGDDVVRKLEVVYECDLCPGNANVGAPDKVVTGPDDEPMTCLELSIFYQMYGETGEDCTVFVEYMTHLNALDPAIHCECPGVMY